MIGGAQIKVVQLLDSQNNNTIDTLSYGWVRIVMGLQISIHLYLSYSFFKNQVSHACLFSLRFFVLKKLCQFRFTQIRSRLKDYSNKNRISTLTIMKNLKCFLLSHLFSASLALYPTKTIKNLSRLGHFQI